MQMTNSDRPSGVQILAPAVALLLLSVLAVPAAAQRGGHGGRGGSGHGHASGHGNYGGQSGHRSGGHGYDYRGRGYRNHGRNHQGYRGYDRSGYGHHGYGRSGYGRSGYSGSSERYGSTRYNDGYRDRGAAHYGYSDYRQPGSYASFNHPGHLGCSTYARGGLSRAYDVAPRYGRSRPHAPHGPRYRNYQSRWAGYAIESPTSPESYESQTTTSREPYGTQEQTAWINLAIEPGDASVYLDGHFLGLASELPQQLQVSAGSHRLEIGRPGFASQQLQLETPSGESLDISTRLEPETTPR